MTGPHDPLARVLFVLLREHLPSGVLDSAIQRARLLHEVPDTPSGAVARHAAECVQALPSSVD